MGNEKGTFVDKVKKSEPQVWKWKNNDGDDYIAGISIQPTQTITTGEFDGAHLKLTVHSTEVIDTLNDLLMDKSNFHKIEGRPKTQKNPGQLPEFSFSTYSPDLLKNVLELLANDYDLPDAKKNEAISKLGLNEAKETTKGGRGSPSR